MPKSRNFTNWKASSRPTARKRRADDGIRTRDLRFTKPLLYQLSYIGGKRAKDCTRRPSTQAALWAGSVIRRLGSSTRALQWQDECLTDLAQRYPVGCTIQCALETLNRFA